MNTQNDYDSAWKDAIEKYFKEFMAFFFPEAHADIDWNKGYEFLDQELQKVVRDADIGRRFADKLVKVFLKTGEQIWVMIHIEVQGYWDDTFPKRMYVYNYRLFDRYDTKVVSLAILADDLKNWRPDSYGYELWGCQVNITFPVVKLIDYLDKWGDLEKDPNPFSIITMAHLKTQSTAGQFETRLIWKIRLMKMLYQRGYNRSNILELFRFIDWLMILPKQLEQRFKQSVIEQEEENKMPYVTSIERLGMQEVATEMVIETLKIRFTKVPETLIRSIESISDLSSLKQLHNKAVLAASIQEFESNIENNSET